MLNYFSQQQEKYLCVRVNDCQVKLQIDVEDNRKKYAYHEK